MTQQGQFLMSPPDQFLMSFDTKSAALMAAGSDGTLASAAIRPSTSTTHTLVSSSETSRPA
jgi:hypothetical protein